MQADFHEYGWRKYINKNTRSPLIDAVRRTYFFFLTPIWNVRLPLILRYEFDRSFQSHIRQRYNDAEKISEIQAWRSH